MASAVDWSGLSGIKAENDDLVTIEATCPTGCEPALLLEIKSKFGDEVVATKHQGRVFFDLQIQAVDQVLDLRIVDNAYVIFDVIPEFDFPSEGQECLDKLIALIHHSFQWEKGLKAWNIIHKFYPTYDHLLKENFGSQQHAEKKLRTDEDIKVLNFRCTCYRSGKNYHPFGSMDVQKAVGGAIQDKFQWGVKMKDSDVDVTLNIDLKQVYSCIKLTKDSLFKRNIEHFGPTTLRATICAGMLKYANVQPGDVVLDPMCGGGSIPLEGCLSDKKAFYFGGEIHEKAVSRCAGNMSALSTKSLSIGTDFVQWDVRRIPMKDNSVDVFVTDLPFGKRSGSKADNRVLYPKILNSMARVVRPKTGRAVLLTQDKNSMFKTLHKVSKFWKTHRQYGVNIGGLSALVYVMSRTENSPVSS